METLIVYPRLFTTGSADAAQRTVFKGDDTVDALYNQMANARGRPLPWSFTDQVLENALRLFGDFDVWINSQFANPYLPAVAKDYLTDTLGFIQGKSRLMSHHSWSFILQPLPDAQPNLSLGSQRVKPLNGERFKTIQVLQQWCQRPAGLHDLVTTLHVLFGHLGRTPS